MRDQRESVALPRTLPSSLNLEEAGLDPLGGVVRLAKMTLLRSLVVPLVLLSLGDVEEKVSLFLQFLFRKPGLSFLALKL